MKKFLFCLCSLVLTICATCLLTACDNDKATQSSSNPINYEIGYELTVYPDCDFNYKVNDECLVHVSDISVVLAQKNEIAKNDTLTEPFYPCVYHISAKGSTDAKFAGKTIYIRLTVSEMYQQFYYYSAIIEADGTINWEYDQTTWTSITQVYFHDVTFVL